MWYLLKYDANGYIVSRAVVETTESYTNLRDVGYVEVKRSEYIKAWDTQDKEDLRRIRAEVNFR